MLILRLPGWVFSYDNVLNEVTNVIPKIFLNIVIFVPPSKGKGKVHPRTGHEGSEGEQRYSSTVSLTSELNEVNVQRYAPAALPPKKTLHPLY